MQHVEENMDDLFRKAAGNYMPNPGDSQWQNIQSQVVSKSTVSLAPVIEKRRKNNKALLLIILLPLMAGVTGYYFITQSKHSINVTAGNSFKQNKPSQKTNVTVTQNTVINKSEKIKPGVEKNNNHYNISGGNKYISVQKIPAINNAQKIILIDDSKTSIAINDDSYKPLPVEKSATPADDFIDKDEPVNQLSSAKKITVETKLKNFYAGISAGPEFNEVKNQGFKKTGFNTGLIAGYKLTKNIAVETGIAYKKKYYFSDGKYFDMAKMPSSMKVISLKGSSDLMEIPISIKYNFINSKASTVFAAAGISSYVLLKENNDYNASVNGIPQNLKGSYKNVSTGLVSSFDFSVGYEHALGKQNSIRVKPYLQAPLKGLGVGSMQVMSVGINVGITRSF